ncbi:MAG: class I SAM-dependent RNA methyltransferase, partial [Spirochaetes bacterium]|nr:class I SAM-dependent RNA methyltransferase [Spirochaetota bacterium]
SEEWPQITKSIWDEARKKAKEAVIESRLQIIGSDRDKKIIEIAKQNAKNAGVDHLIKFESKALSEFHAVKETGWIVTNPPYGDRIGEKQEVEELYRSMGQLYKKLKGWSFNVLTSYPGFEKNFQKKADKNRKLYNGKIQCYYYQYK